MWDKYPFIKKAALEIAYDNGMINRFEPEDKFLNCCAIIATTTTRIEDLQKFEKFLSTLNADDFSNFCIGEHVAMKEIASKAPLDAEGKTMDRLMGDFFDGC